MPKTQTCRQCFIRIKYQKIEKTDSGTGIGAGIKFPIKELSCNASEILG